MIKIINNQFQLNTKNTSYVMSNENSVLITAKDYQIATMAIWRKDTHITVIHSLT